MGPIRIAEMGTPAKSPKAASRKLRLEVRHHFSHHRCGWSWVEEGVAAALGFEEAPTLFVGALESHFSRSQRPIGEPWVGISHHAIDVPPGVENAYASIPISLVNYRDLILASLPDCRGIFTLSEHMKRRLGGLLPGSDVLIERLFHPTPLEVVPFSWEAYRRQERPKIIQLGHWFRRFHTVYDLPTERFDKLWLPGRLFDIDRALDSEGKRKNLESRVSTPGRLPDDEYDVLLSRNIALLPLYDASACNSLLECIARATPVLTEPLPALMEYLGEEYPFYFRTLEEAARKAEDEEAVKAAHLYLSSLTKAPFSRDYFVHSLATSEIYKNLR